jgi:hypothetical protein
VPEMETREQAVDRRQRQEDGHQLINSVIELFN